MSAILQCLVQGFPVLFLVHLVGTSTPTLDEVWKELQLLKQQFEYISVENSALKKEIESSRKKRLLDGTFGGSNFESNKTQIGFYATLQTGGDLGTEQTIEFRHVHENHGNGYDSRHGHFVAPQTGLYHFSATIYSTTTDGPDLHCEIVKNGNQIGRLFSNKPAYATSTQNVVVYLQKGDMVWVRHNSVGSPYPQTVYANDYTSFSGFLIA